MEGQNQTFDKAVKVKKGRDESAPAPPGITRDGSCEAWGPLARDLDPCWPGKMFFLLNPAYDVIVQGPVWANPLCALTRQLQPEILVPALYQVCSGHWAENDVPFTAFTIIHQTINTFSLSVRVSI